MGGVMKTDRGFLLGRRVSRLTSQLNELREVRVRVAQTDSVRLQLLDHEIELAEIELETATRVLALHRASKTKKSSVNGGLPWGMFLSQLANEACLIAI